MKKFKIILVIALLFPLKFYGQCYNFTITVTPPSCLGCCDGNVTLNNLTGGCPPYMYVWNIGNTTPYIPEACFDTTYTLTIIDFGSCCPDTTIECKISYTTDIHNNLPSKATTLSFFPNPFSNYATFEISNRKENTEYSIEIFNLLGECVQSYKNIHSDLFNISANNLGSGIYLYKVSDSEKEIGSGKIILK